MLAQANAARLLKTLRQSQAQTLRQQALEDPQDFIRRATQQGYSLTQESLPDQLGELTEEDLAGIYNPGVGPRRHLWRK
ncbi:Nif11-like leader peptide family natural product precursor [Synechococcales cyanobacterium C]|uniref:Nif11-like leader peptide family natural product n=1 Tax=Petrachloros mirabilis ULC683 TaxID=2781853 RepID=A0A8K2A1S1_9CYAN|nr:Nif11-like leader peptide family natural product precursor [Petrachloros mirabilis]NCJ08111.1 Nif11-like leader peptide family natural product precursor [Petrachloros mirabilis ULC683]